MPAVSLLKGRRRDCPGFLSALRASSAWGAAHVVLRALCRQPRGYRRALTLTGVPRDSSVYLGWFHETNRIASLLQSLSCPAFILHLPSDPIDG